MLDAATAPKVLVVGCGALAREIVALTRHLSNVDVTCLPATLHNRPGGIPAAVRAKIRAARPRYQQIFIAYADCGTGGLLDKVLTDEGVERLPGAHCYEFYSGSGAFGALMDEEPGTFFLTDFLARNFDRLVVVGLGLDRHPDLLSVYFGNYRRVVYLAQTDDPTLVAAARRAAKRLGLAFEWRRTGYRTLATSVVRAADAARRPFAVAANKGRPGSRMEQKPGHSLLPQQENGQGALEATRGLALQQVSSRPASRSSGCLHPRRRRKGFLRGGQTTADRSARETPTVVSSSSAQGSR